MTSYYDLPLLKPPVWTWEVPTCTGGRGRAGRSATSLVTSRMPSLDVDGKRVHQVGLPYHWGSRGVVTGDVVNDLLAISEEPNVKIFESKGLTCNLTRAGSSSYGGMLDRKS